MTYFCDLKKLTCSRGLPLLVWEQDWNSKPKCLRNVIARPHVARREKNWPHTFLLPDLYFLSTSGVYIWKWNKHVNVNKSPSVSIYFLIAGLNNVRPLDHESKWWWAHELISLRECSSNSSINFSIIELAFQPSNANKYIFWTGPGN